MNFPAFILALILILSIVALVFSLAWLGKSDTDTFKILVGALMSVGFTNVIGFYFGSSVASKGKDETISALATGGNTAVTAAAQAAAPAAAVAVEEEFAKRDQERKLNDLHQ